MAISGPAWGGPHPLAGQTRNPSGEQPPSVQVAGRVVDHGSGEPVPGATVSLASGPQTRGIGTRVTDDDGRFLFREVPTGFYRLTVQTQGYRRMSDTLQVSPEEDLELLLPLSPDPIRLEPIIVTAERWTPPIRDYERRSKTRSVFLVTRDEIEERRPLRMSDLLNAMPGGIVVPTPPYGYTLLLRGQCRPGVWLDGIRVPDVNSIDQFMSPHDVEAIEVYHGFELPVEFGVNPCGGILIWTRMGEPEASKEETGRILSRLAAAAGIALLFLLMAR